MNTKPFWIKERHNPQLGIYYVVCGQISKTAARKKRSLLYGYNVMHCFDSEAEYNNRITELRQRGEKVQ